MVKAYIVGDLHFETKTIKQSLKFIDLSLKSIKEKKPDFIVLLGDILHYHNRVEQQPFDIAQGYIYELSLIAHTYVLVGNHDYINPSQFMTDKHFFNPLKKWNNVTIVDKCTVANYEINTFVFMPYVSEGRFIEGLSSLSSLSLEGDCDEGNDFWKMADCIFAHQEFNGCLLGNKTSTKGDKWDETYPPIISGHIHEPHVLKKNIFYTGSAMQHTFGEKNNKYLWFVDFNNLNEDNDPCYNDYFKIEKIKISLRGKKTLKISIEEIEEKYDEIEKEIEMNDMRVVVIGHKEELKIMKKKEIYNKLKKIGVKIEPEIIKIQKDTNNEKVEMRKLQFDQILDKIIKSKSKSTQFMYNKIITQ